MYLLLGFLGFLVPIIILVAIVYGVMKIVKNKDESNFLTLKEATVDLSIFVSLVTSIVALLSILFAAIDKKFVDILKSNRYYSDTLLNDDIRIAVSVILVAFPIYLALAYYRAKMLRANPSRQNLPATKFVHYAILTVSSLFIVGSIITVIYQYLGGDLGVAFFWKVASVLIISIVLGLYSYYTINRNYKEKTNLPNIFAIISLIAVVLSVVYSINILGSPAKIRKIKIDNKRLEDLSNIQNRVMDYWRTNKALPTSIVDIKSDGINGGYVVTTDPVTGDNYDYKIIKDSKLINVNGQQCLTFYPNKWRDLNLNNINSVACQIPGEAVFEICANFDTVRAYDENGIDQSGSGWDARNELGVSSISTATSMKYQYVSYFNPTDTNPNWNHNVGKHCFKRTIDPLKNPQY